MDSESIYDFFWRNSRTEQAKSITAAKKKEKLAFERFVRTGCPGSRLDVSLTQGGKVQVFGEVIQDSCILMTMDEKTITANRRRASHIKELLEELAERESLTLNITSSPLKETERLETGVAFWHFKNMGEVDDSRLVSKATPGRAEATQWVAYDPTYIVRHSIGPF